MIRASIDMRVSNLSIKRSRFCSGTKSGRFYLQALKLQDILQARFETGVPPTYTRPQDEEQNNLYYTLG